ncbi:MAG: response regulator transcription factor, partial [Spirochaetota bacterium]
MNEHAGTHRSGDPSPPPDSKEGQRSGPAPKLRVIFVEDEEELREVLVAVHSRFGHDARGCGDGASLDRLLADYPADVIVLDLNLPGEDGISISRRIRAGSNCGIIMMTSRGQLTERLKGFECGADIYFVKPIEPVELNAAIESLARRLVPTSTQAKAAWHFDPRLSELTTPRGIEIELTAQECTVMKLLLASPGQTVHRLDIFSA